MSGFKTVMCLCFLFSFSNILIRLDNIVITLLTCAQTRVFVNIQLVLTPVSGGLCTCSCTNVCVSRYL